MRFHILTQSLRWKLWLQAFQRLWREGSNDRSPWVALWEVVNPFCHTSDLEFCLDIWCLVFESEHLQKSSNLAGCAHDKDLTHCCPLHYIYVCMCIYIYIYSIYIYDIPQLSVSALRPQLSLSLSLPSIQILLSFLVIPVSMATWVKSSRGRCGEGRTSG